MIKKMVKAFTVAFSVYSKIPMPRFIWESSDMEYSMGFFPLVGAVIGFFEWVLYLICNRFELPDIFRVTLAIAIPLIITGGIHLDGYIDTSDARNSYQDREKKLEILKDPHIGAFAVIKLSVFILIAAGMLSLIKSKEMVIALCVNFTIARVFSAFSVVTMKAAKKDGMLHSFANNASRNTVIFMLILEAVISCILIALADYFLVIPVIFADLFVYIFYGQISKKEFGGITGDLAGYFLCNAELMALIVLAIISILR